ncbi:phosphate ABC transporter periplasmic phosphate-binding protein [Calothrix sp. NIES-4101]|nr:phosphate ABC transporter periplasmic phosphate-binding protein [Calothrix sp. NIES-4101]
MKMNIKSNHQAPMVLGALTAVATLAVAIPAVYSQSAAVRVDGSSTVFPVTQAAAEGFQKTGKGRVTVGVSGTGGGFQKFCRGETDISNASRPIKKKEMAACKSAGINYIEIPIAFDGITVVVHPQNNWVTNLTTAELKKIWEPAAQGKVTKWNQIRSGLPNQALKLFGPGTKSGTFDYFTEAINGKSGVTRTDFTASEDDNVLVNGVARDKGGLGYFGYDYYVANKNKLKAVAVNGVLPSDATIISGKYNPLSRPLFIYVNAKSIDKPAVKDFVRYYITNGAAIAKKGKAIPLPSSAYNAITSRFNSKQTGTVFGGEEKIGATVNDVLAKPKN